ncbi:hypothetical protein P7C70_g376, partial [Phenoliferia sp. Uapishka_3]
MVGAINAATTGNKTFEAFKALAATQPTSTTGGTSIVSSGVGAQATAGISSVPASSTTSGAPGASGTKAAAAASLFASRSWLDTPDGEVAFLRALIHRRPVGVSRHWTMIDIITSLKKTAPRPAFERMEVDQPWVKYNQLYNSDFLEEQPGAKDADATLTSTSTPSLSRESNFDLSILTRHDISFEKLQESRRLRSQSTAPSPPTSPVRDFPPPVISPVPTPRTAASSKKRKAGDEGFETSGGQAKKVVVEPEMKKIEDASSDVSELTDLEDEVEEEVLEDEADGERAEEGEDVEGDGEEEGTSAGGSTASAAQSPAADVGASSKRLFTRDETYAHLMSSGARIRALPSVKKKVTAPASSRSSKAAAAQSDASDKTPVARKKSTRRKVG